MTETVGMLSNYLYDVFVTKFDGWVMLGFVAQAFFTMRFVVQWIASERARKSVIPVAFWFFSIGGGILLLAMPYTGETRCLSRARLSDLSSISGTSTSSYSTDANHRADDGVHLNKAHESFRRERAGDQAGGGAALETAVRPRPAPNAAKRLRSALPRNR